MKHKILVGWVGAFAALSMALPWGAQAEIHVASGAAGAKYSTILGDGYQSYSQPVGFQAQVWAADEALLGKSLQFHGELSYVPYKLRGLNDFSLTQWGFLAGLETGRERGGAIRPFASVDIGATYSRLGIPSGATNVSTILSNTSSVFTAQFCSGVDMPIIGNLSASVAMPLKVIFSSNKMTSLDGEFSLRWAL